MTSEERNELWEALGRKSKLCLRRKRWRFGRSYSYTPRSDLVRRLAVQFGVTETEIISRLRELREFILKFPQYFRV